MGITCIKDHRPEHSLGDERWHNGCAQCEIEQLNARIADLELKLACARAEAVEECAIAITPFAISALGFSATAVKVIDEKIRALAPAPSGYVCVTVETIQEAQAALYGCKEVIGDVANIQHAINLLAAARGEK